MIKHKFTYRLKLILTGVLVWEVIFWLLYILLTNSLGWFGNVSSDKLGYIFPSAFYLLIVMIPVLGIFIFNLLRTNKIAASASVRVAQSFLRPVSSMSAFLKFFFFRNAIILLIIAISQPVYGTKKVKGTSESLELVVALDISNSMNTRDISADFSRLDISKRALIQLINNLHGEKIGISLFANNAFVHLPITSDYGAAKLFIEDIETSMISSQGTNIGMALGISSKMFSKQKTTKGIILITDGEDHEGSLDRSIKDLKEKNLQLSILGIGTKKGGLIPKNPYRPNLGYKTDARGKTVVSKLNEAFIQKLATQTGGTATVSSSEFPDLSALLTEINQMKRTKIDTLDFDIKQQRYQVPLFLAILFWLAFLLWSKNYVGLLDKWIKK
ncbi:MAG: VWA domain-containing protein [Crocinitomicaceae bacterium]|nr:VWA domain-containing protein [Flavobacteriales bacterium]NQZ37395.1 VWA domain-containing protein [Crocinitomicaceae bacterium]